MVRLRGTENSDPGYPEIVKSRARGLVDRAASGDDEVLGSVLGAIQRDGSESFFVLGNVLREQVIEGFSLLGAEVNALEVIDFDLVGGLLVDGAENHEKIPDGKANLDAVCVRFAVVFGLIQGDFGVIGLGNGLAHDSS